MKILFSLPLIFLSFTAIGQQTDLQKFIQDAKAKADAVKKSNPGTGSQPGLPAGYDNSWKVITSITRTVTGTTDLVSTDPGCKATKRESISYRLNADLSSDKAVGWLNGDDFEINTDLDNDLKKYAHPLKGSYNINTSENGLTTSCDGSTSSQYTGGTNIDPPTVKISFHFNKKDRKGDFQVALNQDYNIQASGKMTTKSKNNPTINVDIADLAKAQIGMLTTVCGLFQSWNYPVSKDASIQQALSSSPVNGGQASIGETKYGYEVSYSETKTIKDVPSGWSGNSEMTYTTTLHILVTNQSPPTLQAIIDPSDVAAYQNFIPKGPKMDGSETEGNSISFRIRIIDTKNGNKDVTEAHPFTVTYTLDHVSAHKGICMNYPKENADEKPDLRWSKLSLAETHLKSNTETTLTSNTREGKDLAAFIASYDYAAYGILKAQVHLDDDDLTLEGHPKDKPEEFFVTIPLDENHNKIADKWEKDIGIYGKIADPDFDEDEFPKNQRRNGDGYTLFEEYRGFKVKDNILANGSHETFTDGHLRMDPDYKDIFINDVDGLFKTYYEPYNPSDLCWHYIDKTEMIFNSDGKDPQNRWTNFNKVPDHFYANQYALIIDDKPAEQGGGLLGEQLNYNKVRMYNGPADSYITHEEQETGFGYDQPVKNTIIVDIYTSEISKQAAYFKTDKQQGTYILLITGAVNHEMGHALGITHHRLPGNIENDSSKVIGVTNCSMRYMSNTEMQKLFLVSRTPYYCRKSDTWQSVTNTPAEGLPPGQAVPLNTTTQPSNNCYGQIDVKSDP